MSKINRHEKKRLEGLIRDLKYARLDIINDLTEMERRVYSMENAIKKQSAIKAQHRVIRKIDDLVKHFVERLDTDTTLPDVPDIHLTTLHMEKTEEGHKAVHDDVQIVVKYEEGL